MYSPIKSLVAFIAIFVFALTVALSIGWHAVPEMISAHLSQQLKVDVEVKAVDLSQNSLMIEQLTIDNPIGSTLPKAFSAELIEIRTPLRNYLHREVVIEEMVLDE